jgi:hypothetical protein
MFAVGIAPDRQASLPDYSRTASLQLYREDDTPAGRRNRYPSWQRGKAAKRPARLATALYLELAKNSQSERP